MDIQKPMTFEEWKAEKAPQLRDELLASMTRLHSIDYKKQWEDLLKAEYQEYLSDFNGNWLFK